MLGSVFLLILNGAILLACAVFIDEVPLLLTAFLLFLPLLDNDFRRLNLLISKPLFPLWLLVCCLIAILIILQPSLLTLIPSILLFAALPEEWFFRRYFQHSLQKVLFTHNCLYLKIPVVWQANIGTSIFFTMLHLPAQGIVGLGVFIPSLFLGWLYTKKQDLILLILLHTFFNLFFINYIAPMY